MIDDKCLCSIVGNLETTIGFWASAVDNLAATVGKVRKILNKILSTHSESCFETNVKLLLLGNIACKTKQFLYICRSWSFLVNSRCIALTSEMYFFTSVVNRAQIASCSEIYAKTSWTASCTDSCCSLVRRELLRSQGPSIASPCKESSILFKKIMNLSTNLKSAMRNSESSSLAFAASQECWSRLIAWKDV